MILFSFCPLYQRQWENIPEKDWLIRAWQSQKLWKLQVHCKKHKDGQCCLFKAFQWYFPTQFKKLAESTFFLFLILIISFYNKIISSTSTSYSSKWNPPKGAEVTGRSDCQTNANSVSAVLATPGGPSWLEHREHNIHLQEGHGRGFEESQAACLSSVPGKVMEQIILICHHTAHPGQSGSELTHHGFAKNRLCLTNLISF